MTETRPGTRDDTLHSSVLYMVQVPLSHQTAPVRIRSGVGLLPYSSPMKKSGHGFTSMYLHPARGRPDRWRVGIALSLYNVGSL